MDYKANLLLVQPIKFHDVCTLYPITIQEILSFNATEAIQYNELFVPYIIRKDMMNEEFNEFDLFEIILTEESLCKSLLKSISVFCKTDNISINHSTFEVFIDDNKSSLNKSNFDEFTEIILTASCKEKIKKEEPQVEPKFETADGRNRWLKLQEMRKKYQKNDDSDVSLSTVINVVQFGTKTYIPEDVIKTWSLWKLINSYATILHIDNYLSNFKIWLQTGSKDLVEEHWTHMIKI